MAVELISKIVPKNNAFVGMVDASQAIVDAAAFVKNLSASDDTVQKALATLDGMTASSLYPFHDATFTGDATVSVDLGSELAPAMTQALWDEGAGWTITDITGIATRVPSAVTTLSPATPIVPDISKSYLVAFTISNWIAGTITMTFGGVVSTSLQGDQTIHIYVNPYTTGNLEFTPSALFDGVVSAVSTKEYSGGTFMIQGEVNYYDSRGHLNRLSHVTRHLSEMQNNTLLDKSRSTLSCTGGVLTYTLYAVYGAGTWNFNGIVYPGAVASASVTLVGGTNAAPKTNWVYFELVNNVPTLKVSSTTEPTGDIIMVAEFIIGAVSGSTYTIYGYNRARVEVDNFISRVIARTENSGTLYESGGLPTVTQSTPWISIAAACKWYTGIFKHESANIVTGIVFYYIKNGVWAAGTTLAELLFYSDGAAVPNHGFANIVWGIVPVTTTASGTVPATVKLFAILQTHPVVDYTTLAAVRQDLYEATNYFPPDAQLKEAFLPIARTIISEDAPTQLQAFDTGLYHKDLRGRITSGGGAATGTDLSGYLPYVGATGDVDMGGSFTITALAAPAAAGEAIRATATALESVIDAGGGGTLSKSFMLTNPTADADGPVWRSPTAITITAVHALTIGAAGENVVFQLWEYDANGANGAVIDGSDITATVGTNANDDGALSNAPIDAGDYLGIRTTSVSGAPTRLIVTFEYTEG
jgi:hypothetical protein